MLDAELQQVRQMILKELPALMQNDTAFRESVISIAQFQFADQAKTDNRFDQMMALLKRFMDEERKKWDENQQQIKDLNRRLEHKIEQDRQKWDENQRQIAILNVENQKKWDKNQQQIAAINAENQKKIEQDHKKWEENQHKWKVQQKTSDELSRKNDQLLGAMGRRWGLHSEASFRNALAGILKDFQEVSVMNVVEWDDTGAVFGHPDEIELDIIIKNGVLIVCEMKSSVSKSDMYIFERKVRFYEQKQTKPVSRLLVISPFVDKYAIPVADKLGIEVYSYADDVNL